MDDVKQLAKSEEFQKNLTHYLELVKRFIVDTKITGEPKQDNFIKCLTFLALLCLLTGNGSDLLITMIISIYPGYMSIKAILSKDTEDDQRWLKYWIISAVFMIVQMPCDWILGWAPGFSLVKIAFLLWCMAPLQENGSVMLFKLVVLPYYEKYSSQIDKMMSEAATSAEGMIKSAVENLDENKQA